MKGRFWLDEYYSYRSYAIYDTDKVEKNKEDFWDEKEEVYDIMAFEDYLLENNAMMISDDVVEEMNKLNDFKIRTLNALNDDFLFLTKCMNDALAHDDLLSYRAFQEERGVVIRIARKMGLKDMIEEKWDKYFSY